MKDTDSIYDGYQKMLSDGLPVFQCSTWKSTFGTYYN